MLEGRNLECVRGQRQLFRRVSVVMQPGDCCELRGPNGSGKTSLLRMLCGLLPPTSGEIRWRGRPVSENREAYHAAISYVGHRSPMKHELTTLENLQVSAALNGCAIGRSDAQLALGRLGLAGLENLSGRRLSEGQQRRVALARLLVCRTAIWFLDEVQTALDKRATDVVMAMIDEHLAGGGLVVIATHQPLMLAAQRTRRIELAA